MFHNLNIGSVDHVDLVPKTSKDGKTYNMAFVHFAMIYNTVAGDKFRSDIEGPDKKAQVALDDAALVFGQAVRVFPGRDVARHVDLLRHPVVGAGGEVFFPSPFVFERHQLVDVGLAIDDALVSGVHATCCT